MEEGFKRYVDDAASGDNATVVVNWGVRAQSRREDKAKSHHGQEYN